MTASRRKRRALALGPSEAVVPIEEVVKDIGLRECGGE
jgi:hypothetical protein